MRTLIGLCMCMALGACVIVVPDLEIAVPAPVGDTRDGGPDDADLDAEHFNDGCGDLCYWPDTRIEPCDSGPGDWSLDACSMNCPEPGPSCWVEGRNLQFCYCGQIMCDDGGYQWDVP